MQTNATIPTPVNAEDIARRSYEQRFLIEDRVIANLVDIINQGIRDQVAHGLLTYEFHVPTFVYGFPRFDVEYVASRLREMYANRGFQVSGDGCRAVLAWSQKPHTEPPPAAAAAPPTASRAAGRGRGGALAVRSKHAAASKTSRAPTPPPGTRRHLAILPGS